MVVERRPASARRASGARAPAAVPSARSAKLDGEVAASHSGIAEAPAEDEQEPPRQMTVCVRVRPLSSREAKKSSKEALTVTDGSKVFAHDPDDKMGGRDYLRLDKSKDHAYRFDFAFGPEAKSAALYESGVQPVVRAVGHGFHGSCFAYGATGSGKTFTMMGEPGAPGVMPMAVQELFDTAKRDDDYTWSFGLTYIEIYNERVKDLLNPTGGTDLEVREDARRGTHIQGALEVTVASLQELMEYMQKGSVYRTTEATNCNAVSSRSHAVLQVTVQALQKFGDGGGKTKRLSKLSLIDLAGSERADKTDNRGQRLVEGRMINQSLLALANCINALADRTKRTTHIPYRDSKLTRLLRDSLSGTSVSAMICAVSPAADQFDETMNTLKYANRAKQMKPPQVPKVQVQPYSEVKEQISVLAELKESLVKIATDMGTGPQTPLPALAERGGGRAAGFSAGDKPGSPRGGGAGGGGGGAGGGGAGGGGARERSTSQAEVQRHLHELAAREPQVRASPAVQSAYQQLDNMEAEEVEAITQEAALLWREQQSLFKEMTSISHQSKVARVRLAWREAAHGAADPEADDPQMAALRQQIQADEASLQRLQRDLEKARGTLRALQADIPARVVSTRRLSTLRLAMRQQQATTDYLRFKDAARDKVVLMQELLRVWHAAIPPQLRALLLTLFDLRIVDREAEELEVEADVDAPYVVRGDGSAQPWNTLGALAQRAAIEGEAGEARQRISYGADGEGGDAIKQAQRELQENRMKRMGVVQFVEEVSSPDRRRGRLNLADGREGGRPAERKRSPLAHDATPAWQRREDGKEGGANGAGASGAGASGGEGGGGEGGGGEGGGGEAALSSSLPPSSLPPVGRGKLCTTLPADLADGVRGAALSAAAASAVAAGGLAVEVLHDRDDPLMQSFHPDMPAWLTATSPLGARVKEGHREQVSDLLKAASAARRAARQGSPAGARAAPTTAMRVIATAPPPPPSTPPPLPAPWQEARDEAGRTYYFHPATKATTWQRPAAAPAPAAPAAGSRPNSARPAGHAARAASAPRARPGSAGPANARGGGAHDAAADSARLAPPPEASAAPGAPPPVGPPAHGRRRAAAPPHRASDGHLHGGRAGAAAHHPLGAPAASAGSLSNASSRSSTPRGGPSAPPPPPSRRERAAAAAAAATAAAASHRRLDADVDSVPPPGSSIPRD